MMGVRNDGKSRVWWGLRNKRYETNEGISGKQDWAGDRDTSLLRDVHGSVDHCGYLQLKD
jgi:hypothetical protein